MLIPTLRVMLNSRVIKPIHMFFYFLMKDTLCTSLCILALWLLRVIWIKNVLWLVSSSLPSSINALDISLMTAILLLTKYIHFPVLFTRSRASITSHFFIFVNCSETPRASLLVQRTCSSFFRPSSSTNIRRTCSRFSIFATIFATFAEPARDFSCRFTKCLPNLPEWRHQKYLKKISDVTKVLHSMLIRWICRNEILISSVKVIFKKAFQRL